MKRRNARQKALQILFSLDSTDFDAETTMEVILNENEKDAFLLDLVEGVIANKAAIDEKIKANLEKWSLNRVAAVERTLLRIAAYEMLYRQDAPDSVVINEAIEIAHVFGGENSGKFINGILSKMTVKGDNE